ncbi:MAG TPA: hypothetical protein VHD62_13835 [Opitutaceae bacterium]|nr:hypothetical protein [Opitutaceae bacterium]
MKPLRRIVAVISYCLLALVASAKEHEESVFLFQNRKVSILVPDGFGFASNKAENGMMTVSVSDKKETLSLSITFLPDPDERFASARSRKEFMNENFRAYVDHSVEQAMQFEDFESKTGAGTFCVFTDASLVGKTKFPRGEFLHSTAGLKAWPGVLAVFSLFSNDTKSRDYQALMTLLRDGLREEGSVPAALAKP